MVVIQEHKKCFVSSRLHLPHGLGKCNLQVLSVIKKYINVYSVKYLDDYIQV